MDAKVRHELRSWLKSMIRQVGVTSIFVTHDQDEAVEVADEIIVTNDGRIEQIGTPIAIYQHPATPFVAQFIGNSAVVEDYGRFRGFQAVEGLPHAIVRPEYVEAFKQDNEKYRHLLAFAEEGTVEDIAFRGSYLEVTLNVCGTKLTTNRSLERRELHKGEKMYVVIYRMYVFDHDHAQLLENSELKGVDVVGG